MRVIRSKVLGFCMGVRRAFNLAVTEAGNARVSGGKVYTLGPLIHNPGVLADLKSRGAEAIHALPENPNGCSVIIRAHGIEARIENEMRGRGVRIVDATCPNVKASQLKAKALAEAGYILFLAGEASHAEIAGILDYACTAENCTVVADADEAEAAAKKLLDANKHAKAALIGQTTISQEEYYAIGEAVKKHFPGLEIVDTICSATKDRQQALYELLDQVDAVIIAGGKDSANTRRLFAIAQNSGKPCVLVENAAEIPSDFFAYQTVGISAGASTPDSVISEIELKLM